MKIYNIVYETDEEEVGLPDTFEVDDTMDPDNIADYISDETGWLVDSFDVE